MLKKRGKSNRKNPLPFFARERAAPLTKALATDLAHQRSKLTIELSEIEGAFGKQGGFYTEPQKQRRREIIRTLIALGKDMKWYLEKKQQ